MLFCCCEFFFRFFFIALALLPQYISEFVPHDRGSNQTEREIASRGSPVLVKDTVVQVAKVGHVPLRKTGCFTSFGRALLCRLFRWSSRVVHRLLFLSSTLVSDRLSGSLGLEDHLHRFLIRFLISALFKHVEVFKPVQVTVSDTLAHDVRIPHLALQTIDRVRHHGVVRLPLCEESRLFRVGHFRPQLETNVVLCVSGDEFSHRTVRGVLIGIHRHGPLCSFPRVLMLLWRFQR